MSALVKLRVGVDRPHAKLKRTVYTDLESMPSTLDLSITFYVHNYDDIALYMRVDGTLPAEWSYTSTDLGSVSSGSSILRCIDHFASRTAPASETAENLTIRVRAYTDAGYTDLKWTYTRELSLLMIKSDDGSWTQDLLNDFDDGTKQGWTKVNEAGTSGADIIDGATYTSSPYSYKGGVRSANEATVRFRFEKAITTANRATVLAITNFRLGRVSSTYNWLKNARITYDTTDIVYVGRASDGISVNYLPLGRWMRFAEILPSNTSLTLKFRFEGRSRYNYDILAWIDDVTIISKD